MRRRVSVRRSGFCASMAATGERDLATRSGLAVFLAMMTGLEMLDLMSRLYPICRSITGDGVRETLRLIQELIPVEVREVPSGTQVFDWVVPKEWNIQDAWIKNAAG